MKHVDRDDKNGAPEEYGILERIGSDIRAEGAHGHRSKKKGNGGQGRGEAGELVHLSPVCPVLSNPSSCLPPRLYFLSL